MKLKALVIAGAVVLAGVVGVLISGETYAAVTCPAGSLRGDKGQTANTYAECNLPVDNGPSLMQTVQTIINVIVGVLGIVAVAVVVLGGVTYVTSQGEAAKLTKAKNTILYGIVGLVVAMLAFAVVNFVMKGVFSGSSSSDAGSSDAAETVSV